MSRYAIQAALGHTPNQAVVPSNINPPIIFIAPAELTVSAGELWFGISNSDPNYGGCYVWLSSVHDKKLKVVTLSLQLIDFK
jgi:hypothetical protein